MVTTHNGDHTQLAAHPRELPARLGLGWKVIAGLAVLTIVEFIVAVTWGRSIMIPLLVIIALYKTVLIALYFMHFKQLWQREEH